MKSCLDCSAPIGDEATRCKKCSPNYRHGKRRALSKTCKTCGVPIKTKDVNCDACKRPYTWRGGASPFVDPMQAAAIARRMDKIIADELLMPWERQRSNVAR